MSTLHKIARNTIFLSVAQAFNFLLTFFYMTYIARYLGPAGYGVLTFSLAFTSIFGVFTDFNLQLLIAREVAREESLVNKYLSNISVMKIILSFITFGMIAGVINLAGYPWQTVQVVYLLGISVILTAFTQIFYAIFQAYQKMEFQAIGQMLNALLMTVLVIIAVSCKLDVVAFGYLYAVAAFIVLLYCIIVWGVISKRVLNITGSFTLRVDWEFWKSTFMQILPFGLSALFVMIFYWCSTIMLSIMIGDEAVGLYNAPYRMVLVLSFIPQALIGALYPVMAKLSHAPQEKFKLYYEKSLKFLLMLAVPLGIGTTVLSGEIIQLLFGSQYSASVVALQLLIWSEAFIFCSVPIVNVFNSLNKQSITTKITALCLLLNVVLNLILIPQWGINGASITTALTEALSLLISFICIVKLGYKPAKADVIGFIKMGIGGLVMAVFLLLFHKLNLLIIVPAAVLVYFITLIVIRVFDKQELDMVKKMFRVEGE